jgi:hypothetical protein
MIIDLFDQNGDGVIDQQEFSVICENIADFNTGVRLPYTNVIHIYWTWLLHDG